MKRTRLNRKSKSTRMDLIYKLDELCKQEVRKRDKMTCQYCGKKITNKKDAHTHHVVPKSHSLYLRHDPMNLVVLCMYCHLRGFHDGRFGKSALDWMREHEEQEFRARAAYLDELKNRIIKISAAELEDMYRVRSAKLADKGQN